MQALEAVMRSAAGLVTALTLQKAIQDLCVTKLSDEDEHQNCRSKTVAVGLLGKVR